MSNNDKDGSLRMPSWMTTSQSRRRRLGRSSPTIVTISCIRRAIAVFTGMIFLGLVWNIYRFGYNSDSSIQKQQQQHQQKPPESTWDDLRDKFPLDHGPVKWKRKRKSSNENEEEDISPKCQGFDHSIRRPNHGCQVNEDTRTVFCNFDNLRIDISKINMVAHGGEDMESSLEVMGRNEQDEFPTYQKAAFSTRTKPKYEVPTEFRSQEKLHYLEHVLNALRYPTAKNKDKLDLTCQHTYKGTTLFLTRYEYVNLFHTLTDWWNAFFVLPRRTNNSNNIIIDESTLSGIEHVVKPDRVVFLDGHAKGLLDPVWETLFGEYHYIKQMGVVGDGGGICFEKAIFVPPGYKSPLYNDFRRKQCPHKGMAKAFSDYVLNCYDLLSSPPNSSSSSSSSSMVIKGNVVVIDRQPFVSHPRSDPKNLSRRFVASELHTLQTKLMDIPGVHSVRLVRLETLSFEEQLKLLRETHFLIGIHGAALSHIVFMDETQSHAIEFQPDTQLDFFEYLSQWKGIDFKVIQLEYQSDSLTDHGIDEAVNMVQKHVHG
jgi:glycoprotein 2-beta-D-xylosyltransferase